MLMAKMLKKTNCVGLERAGGNIETQVIGEDGVGGVIADQDHEEAQHKLQETHDQVEAPQSYKLRSAALVVLSIPLLLAAIFFSPFVQID